MTRVFDPKDQSVRFAPLGLIANPFLGVDATDDLGVQCEIASASDELLRAIAVAATEEKARPIWVAKDPNIPNSYPMAADSRVEQTLAGDDSLNVLHGYMPLFAMRDGAVRSIIQLLGERLVWRDFDRTLAAYVARVLASPDESLPSFQVMGPDALEAFATAFAEDATGAVVAVLGEPLMERVEELAQSVDMRQLNFVGDGAETAEADGDEVDETVPDAPGLGVMTAEHQEEAAEADPFLGVADYIIDYTRAHLSPVMGRALRVYRERGLAATAREFNITKAPRKTLTAIVKFARARFDKVVLMWDGFESWGVIEPELRSKIVGLLSETRWTHAEDAVFVFMVGDGSAPELEESFGSGTRVSWSFPGLVPIEEAPDEILPEVVERWIANATLAGQSPLTLADEKMAALVEAASGSMKRLVVLGGAAIQNVVERGLARLDDASIEAAIEELARFEAEEAAQAARELEGL